jgi:hypothetical protein
MCISPSFETPPVFVIGRDWIVNSENRAVLYLKLEPLGLFSIAGSQGPPALRAGEIFWISEFA